MTPAFEMDAVNYSEMRENFKSHLENCSKYGKRYKIMRNGKPEGILLSTTEWEQILDTLAIVTDAKMMKQLIQSEKDIQKGRVQSLDDAFNDLLDEG